jgi:hypothetical protein
MDTRTKTIEVSKFKELKGSTGVSLFVLNKEADHATSMKLLDEAGLRPLEKEEIRFLVKDKELRNPLRANWFYIAGQGEDEDGLFAINEETGMFSKGKGSSVENTVRVYKGKYPRSLYVCSDNDASVIGRRYYLLYADYSPDYAAPVVVGVPKEKILQGSTESDKTLAAVQAELRDQEKAIKEKKDKKTALNEQTTALDKEKGALDKEIAEREKRVTKLKEVAELLRKE